MSFPHQSLGVTVSSASTRGELPCIGFDVAQKNNVRLVSLAKTGMLHTTAVRRRLGEAAEEHQVQMMSYSASSGCRPPSLSIVIPNYNGLKHLQRCLPSVFDHAPPGTQTIVVDDASTDASVAWLQQFGQSIEVVALDANQGFCHAVNAGIARATGEIVELLNNDTEVCEGWAKPALEHFRDPLVGSVAPLVLRMDQPEIIDSAGQVYHICGWALDRKHGQPLTAEDEQVCEVFGPSASAGFYRRRALERTGGFWEPLIAYYDDTDLAFRMRWCGFRCIYEPNSRVLHNGSATYSPQSDRVIWLLSRNEELAFWSNMPTSRLLVASLPHLGFCVMRLTRKLLQGKVKPFLRGKLDAVRMARTIHARRTTVKNLVHSPKHARVYDLSADARTVLQGVRRMRRRKSA